VLRTPLLLAAMMAALSIDVAVAQPAPTQPQDQAADLAALQTVRAKDACLEVRAKAVDDRVSPPEKIAVLMKDACYAEEDRALLAMNAWAERHGVEKEPPTFTAEQRLGLAALAVQMARGHNDGGK
jgi:hypothetical protein